jgi:hypothetical protein
MDDELSGEVATALLRHMAGCAVCQSRQIRLALVRDALREMPQESVATGFAERLTSRLPQSVPRAADGAERWPAPAQWGTTGGLAAVLLLLAFASGRLGPERVPAPDSPWGHLAGFDCGLVTAMECHSEQLCDSAALCGPAAISGALGAANHREP